MNLNAPENLQIQSSKAVSAWQEDLGGLETRPDLGKDPDRLQWELCTVI